jgi:hypothetical protein
MRILTKLGESLAIPTIYALIYLSWGGEIVKKVYYVIFLIPHVKVDGKFHPEYLRIKT